MEPIKSEKGRVLAVCSGYAMRKDKCSSNGLKQFWRCPIKGCRGRAESPLGFLVLKEKRAHDLHGPSPVSIEARTRLTKVKKDALENLAVTSQLATDVPRPKYYIEI